MMRAGLSGVVATWAPRYIGADSSGGTVSRVRSSGVSPADWARSQFADLIRDPEFSLAEGALLMSAVIGRRTESDFDPVGQSARLDELAARVGSPTASGVFGSLFMSGRFSGDRTDYYSLENSLLDRVVERGLGIPISLSVIMIDVARRLGTPLVGVGLPGHFVVGVPGSDGIEEFYDPFTPSGPLTRGGCEVLVSRLAGRPIRLNPAVFVAQSPVAVMERMLNNMKSFLVRSQPTAEGAAALNGVMWLRSVLPSIGGSETDEWSRLMAPLN